MQTMNVRRVCVSKTCLVRTPLRNTKYIIIIIIIVWRRRRTLCADKPRRQRFSTNSIPAPSERYRRYYRVIYTRLCCSTTFFFFFLLKFVKTGRTPGSHDIHFLRLVSVTLRASIWSELVRPSSQRSYPYAVDFCFWPLPTRFLGHGGEIKFCFFLFLTARLLIVVPLKQFWKYEFYVWKLDTATACRVSTCA